MSDERSGRPRFGVAVFALTTVRLASVGASFLVSVLAARVLGASGLAAIAVASTVATGSALLANPGLGIAAVYFLVRRPEQRAGIVRSIVGLGLPAAIVAALLVLASVPLASRLLLPEQTALVLVAAAGVAPSIVAYEVGIAALLGMHRRGAYIALEAGRSIGTLATTAIFLAVAPTETFFVLATAAATAGTAAVAWVVVRRAAGAMAPEWDARFAREALGMGIPGQVGNFVVFLNLRLDFLLVPALLSLQAAGVYVIAVRVAEVVTQLANSVSSFLFPEVAAQLDVRATTGTERVVRGSLVVVVASIVFLAIVAEPLLGFAFGPAFVSGAAALRITMIGMVPLAVARILIGDLKGRGRADLVSVVNVAAVILTVVLDLVLVPLLGIIGAAIASVVVYSVTAVLLLAVYRRLTGASLLRLVPGPRDAIGLFGLGRRVRNDLVARAGRRRA